jgi:hypothetical protein
VTCYPELTPARSARLDAEYIAAICAAADDIPATRRARRYAARVAAVRAH